MSPKMKPRAVLYLRQSKARDDSISIEIQESQCRGYCDRKGYAVHSVVIDEGVSAYRDWKTRPNFPRALEAIESGEADLAVVYRWSRLTRRKRDQLALIDLLGTVESAVEPIDISTAGGRMSRDLIMNIAAYESEVKSEQWKEALDRRIERGLPKSGHPRFGYIRSGGRFEPDSTTGPVLRDLYLRYTAGAGFQALAKTLNEEGITTTRGTSFQTTGVARTLDSGFGAGLLVKGSVSGKNWRDSVEYLDGGHEGVITAAEWEAYLVVRHQRKAAPPRARTSRWHLRGLIRCGRCGAVAQVNSYASPNSSVICSAYKDRRTCDGVWVSRSYLEGRVGIWLGGHLEELADLLPSRDAERAVAQTRVDEAQAELNEAVASLGKLAVSHAKGLIDDDAYRAAEAVLTEERDAAKDAVTVAKADVSILGVVDGDVFDRLANAPETTPGEWGETLSKVIRRVEVFKDRLVFVPVVGEPYSDPR